MNDVEYKMVANWIFFGKIDFCVILGDPIISEYSVVWGLRANYV